MADHQSSAFPDVSSLPNRDLYAVLEVDRTADEDTIRRAYRRKALKCHPDKVGNTPENVDRFQLVQKAYDVLSDPKKRQVFDKYGERGVAMMDSMGNVFPFVDPEFLLAVNTFFILGSLLAALLIIFPALISVRADGRVSWKWSVVSIPLFILDACLLLVLWRLRASAEPDAAVHHAEMNEGETFQERDRREKRKRMKASGSAFVKWLLFLLLQIFIIVRLDDTVDWNWGIVFAPWFILEAVSFIDHIAYVNRQIREGASDHMMDPDAETGEIANRKYSTEEKAVLVFDEFRGWTLRIIQLAVLIPKFNGTTDASWGLLFLPTWLWIVVEALSITLGVVVIKRAARRAGRSQIPELATIVTFRIVLASLIALFLYLFTGLLVKRLQNGGVPSPSTAVILIPVFIIASFVFCCCCCCGPCVVGCIKMDFEAQFEKEGDGQISLTNRRITYNATDAPSSSSSR
ncbi:uncharacterized protein EV422DRAFT_520597 [Fimicolochytrium jonesii]|uniref:uncharacterized protein n=1 Tax=Fimicolochytrium jonesii TaxID=1396493 RepID=UPI0022FE71DF|nr:uncharacterized protein EV422DRAFT_520597 [Fimicolochytrium jonesii]KAI8824580.1 hypothetical protein EV422DRAFT_520597 [Fimicolochytrium jonesii]